MTERLSAQDASFLYLEGPNTPYHVASLAIFERGPADERALLDAIERALHLAPRFRQRLAFVPLNQGRPIWVDDEHFDLRYHVRHVTLPPPGNDHDLRSWCGRVMAEHLNRARPLWEMWIIDGLSGDRFAILTKTHHCVVDGITGADMLTAILDVSPEMRSGDVVPWLPMPSPSGVRRTFEAIAERAALPLSVGRGLTRLAASPWRLRAALVATASTAGALAGAARRAAPACPLNTRVGPNRRIELAEVPLADVKLVKNALGGTVNDVVLAAVAGSLRAWLIARGEKTDDVTLQAMVPVNVRTAADRHSPGNRVATLFAPLPVHEADPVRRLDIVRNAMQALKGSPQAHATDLLMGIGNLLPPPLLALTTRVQNVQRLFNVVVTNVPGPQLPLYAVGHRAQSIYPLGPIPANVALTIALLSYDGKLAFGLTADADALPDVRMIGAGISRCVQELVAIAREGSRAA